MAKAISTLPVGSKVKELNTKYNGQVIIWKLIGVNHPGYPANSVTLLTDRIISLKSFDAKEASNSDTNRQSYGNNRYLYSNIRQWLNKDVAAPWYVAQHAADAPPSDANVWSNYNEYDAEAGFLTNLSAQFKAALLTTTLTVAKNTVTDGGGSETVSDKVFLLSETEVGLGNENSIAEGSAFSIFAANADRQAYPTPEAVSNSQYTNASLSSTQPWYWWLRTPYAGNSYYARFVNSDGSLLSNYAYIGNHGLRPALNLGSGILVSDSPDADGAYIIQWNSPPTISGTDSNLGNKSAPFSIVYQVNDVDAGNTVSITEKIDSTILRTITNAALNTNLELVLDLGTWNGLSLSSHTITITATDNNGASTVRTYTFTKVNSAPGTLTLVSPADTYRTGVRPVLEAMIGDDPENDGQKFILQIAEDSGFTVGVQTFNSGTNQAGWEAKTATGAYGPVPAAGVDASYEGGKVRYTFQTDLTEGKTYYWRMAPIDGTTGSQGNWSASRRIRVGNILQLRLAAPIVTSAAAARIVLSMVKTIATDGAVPASFKVEVCNNGLDANPAWEDATSELANRTYHEFINTVKTAADWAIDIRITVQANDSLGEISIDGFGFSFD